MNYITFGLRKKKFRKISHCFSIFFVKFIFYEKCEILRRSLWSKNKNVTFLLSTRISVNIKFCRMISYSGVLLKMASMFYAAKKKCKLENLLLFKKEHWRYLPHCYADKRIGRRLLTLFLTLSNIEIIQ